MIEVFAIEGVPEGRAYLLPADLVAKLRVADALGPLAKAAVLAEVEQRAKECARLEDVGK